MKRTIGDTFWTELRWRVGLQLIIWGMKIAPAGDARGALIETFIAWSDECRRQRQKREKRYAY